MWWAIQEIAQMFFVLAILAIIFGSICGWFPPGRHSKRERRDRAELEESLRTQMSERLAQIEDRIRVLERIVTDERIELRRQFRDL